jgi:hypothetical protein
MRCNEFRRIWIRLHSYNNMLELKYVGLLEFQTNYLLSFAHYVFIFPFPSDTNLYGSNLNQLLTHTNPFIYQDKIHCVK